MGVFEMLIILALVMFAGIVHTEAAQQAGSVHATGKDEVLAYWQQKLGGASMPSLLRGMITPLNAHQATELRTQILQRRFLPAHAAVFCRATASACDRASLIRSSGDQIKYGYQGNPSPSSSKKIATGTFFRQNLTLVVGAKIPRAIGVETEVRAFLPRELADLFPWTEKSALSKVSRMLSIGKATQATMEETLTYCKQEYKMPTEIKACLASIESIVDFSSTLLNSKPITVLGTSEPASRSKSSDTMSTIISVKAIKQDLSDKYVACHDLSFPFRIFYCHYLDQTRIFLAAIQAQDGAIQNSVALCHYDTSLWNPSHSAFLDLKTKPGQSEACHWMGKSGIVFFHQNVS